jgi:hypothetical protein
VEASRYMRLHNRRLMSTTTAAMISVEANNKSKCPASLARLMVLPRPGASTMWPLEMKSIIAQFPGLHANERGNPQSVEFRYNFMNTL